jgi:hypothetical protein
VKPSPANKWFRQGCLALVVLFFIWLIVELLAINSLNQQQSQHDGFETDPVPTERFPTP